MCLSWAVSRQEVDLRFLGSFGDQASAIAEARREATLCAPSTVIVLAADGQRQVIEVDGT